MAPMSPGLDGSIPEAKTAVERKWDVAFGGMLFGQQQDDEHQRWSMSPLYSDYNVRSAELGESSTVAALWSQLAAVSLGRGPGRLFRAGVIRLGGANA